MRLPFFRSRKSRKSAAADDADRGPEEKTSEADSTTDARQTRSEVPEARTAPNSPARSRRVPAEQVVEAFGYALAAVPSLGPTVKAWRKLGFHVSENYRWQGCQAAHIDLEGGGLRFVAIDPQAEATPAADLVRSRLIQGAGLFGWTWACSEPHRSALAIGQLAGKDFHADCEDWGDQSVQIPAALTPAAATWLEKPAENPAASVHANSITRLDHLVLQVSASKAAGQLYEKHFGLKARTAALNERYYAYLQAGPSRLEVVGPIKPAAGGDEAPPSTGAAESTQGSTRIGGGPWGLAFGSTNLDATIAFLKTAGVAVTEPQRAAAQGGRISGMTSPLGGIQLAFLGE